MFSLHMGGVEPRGLGHGAVLGAPLLSELGVGRTWLVRLLAGQRFS